MRFILVRGTILIFVLVMSLSIAPVPGLDRAAAQSDTPAGACGTAPNVACPGLDDPAMTYIVSVTAVQDGVIILLTDAGLEEARACGGAEEIAQMAKTLYDIIPADQRAAFQLDWSDPKLADEIYGHAFFNQMASGIGALSNVYDESNPINVVFADYGGPGEMTATARAEQAVFVALGTAHRMVC